MKNINDKKLKNVQYKIYKLNTFDFFTKEENEKYNEIKKSKGKMKEMQLLFEKYTGQRVLNSKALNKDNEIALFDSDLLRIVRNEGITTKLVKEIVFIKIYHNEILLQILENGFKFEDKEFVFYSASAGQVRNKTITCIQKVAFERNQANVLNSLTVDEINKSEQNGVNLGKLMAYISLTMSSSIPVEIDIDRVIVVPDFETFVTKEVEYIDNETLKSEVNVMPVPVNHCDGAGMFLPDILDKSCQIRCRWIKGALFPFDFKRFALNVAKRVDIIDVYGDSHNIIKENTEIILSASQVKMWKYYNDWNSFKMAFKENKLKFSITNEARLPKNKTELTYQFLQTLDMTDANIELLCNDTVDKIKRMHDDPQEMLIALGATEDNENMEPLQEALTLYPELLQDVHVKKQVKKVVNSYRRNAMAGRILTYGFYAYLCPDLYAYCQRIFQRIEEPKGLIPDGYVYNSFYNDKKVYKCDLLRSPHLYNEHCVRKLVKTKECKKWYLGNDKVISCHDLTLLTLMADVDGDTAMVCTSKPIIKSIRKTVPLYYKMFKAEPQQINTKNIYDTLIRGFESNCIGDISNAITKAWNVDGEIDFELIKKLQMYNNFTIDFPKTGINIELDDLMKKKFELFKTQSNPFFFKYAKDKNKVQGINKSVVNRICKHIKECTNNLKYKPFAKEQSRHFEYAILTSNTKSVRRDTVRYEKLQQELFKWEQKLQYLTKKLKKIKDEDEDFITKFNIAYEYCREELLQIYHGNVDALVDDFIDIEYCQPYNETKQKTLLWNVFGDVVLRNIKNNLNSDIKLRSRTKLAYDTEDKEKYEKAKPKIKLMETPKTVVITKNDMEVINSFKPKNWRDRLIFYVITCLCKAYSNELYVSKSKKGKLTANKIQNLVGVKTYHAAIKRLVTSGLITVTIENRKTKISLVKTFDGETAFTVENIWNPMFSLEKYEGKAIGLCKICGEEFIKVGNAVTCSKRCATENKKRNKKKSYEESKKHIDDSIIKGIQLNVKCKIELLHLEMKL